MSIKGHWHRRTSKSLSDREVEIRWNLATSKISEEETKTLLEELEKLTKERIKNVRNKQE